MGCFTRPVTPQDADAGRFGARYNVAVATPAPHKPTADDKHQHHHSIYAAEATGLLLMAVLLLILTIIHYWRYIPWSVR
jgi:hypothetical protein